MKHTIISKIASIAQKQGDKVAVISRDLEMTYGQLWANVNAAAENLKSMDIVKGDRVILSASSSAAFIYAYLGTHLAGAAAVPVDPNLPTERLEFIVNATKPAAVYASSETSCQGVSLHPLEEIISSPEHSNCSTAPWPAPDQTADILFTTGTTGKPKGVKLTHSNILAAANNINAFILNTVDDTEVIPLPLSHSFGLGRLRCNLISGAKIVLVDGFTYIGQVMKAIETHMATGIAAVPAGIAMMLKYAADKLGSFSDQIKYIEIGSAPMPLVDKQKLMALLPRTRICMHYGLTEASRAAFIEFHASADKIESSIGKPSPNVRIKIVGKNNEPLPANAQGKIMIKGDMTMEGYFQDDSLTKQTLKQDWVDTGDIGHIDDDGYYYLDGREKELINVGGRKVAPIEVENVLVSHPSIKDCACIGIPDPNNVMGEVVKAFVVFDKDADERPTDRKLLAFMKSRLEPYKLPSVFEWIASIPKTASGKTQRLMLKDR